jgi:t-SNARE complex subunit (syntaxin)
MDAHKTMMSLSKMNIDRQQSRIEYLEKTIERIESEHASTLVSLHEEIARLSTTVSGIYR